MAHRIVGQPLGRLDGADKVSGAARYSADVTLPGLVWGKALRSPLPHARIVRIVTSKARACRACSRCSRRRIFCGIGSLI